MCGISGVIFKDRNRKNYRDIIYSMNNLIAHRGPDNRGIYAGDYFVFGHTRLSIIDTSIAGHQPMIYKDRYVITFNGEIYNYLEIKSELIQQGYEFNSHSDTEVILAGYDYWEDDVVNKLNGMFAFAIYDLAKNQCFLARDRVGIKPLYYYETLHEFYFFSEPKQIVFSGVLDAQANERAIEEYLAFQFSFGDKTFFQGVKKLLPGHIVIVDNLKKTANSYWSLDDFSVDKTIAYNEAKETIRNLVEDAVRLRLRSDVRVGCYLSGGIDSSVVAGLASKYLDNLDTYTFVSKEFPEEDESVLAQKTSMHIRSAHHEIEIDFTEIFELWKKSIYHMDEPEVGFSLLSQMKISKEVAKDLKVILGGQGGDELFYGYGWHTEIALLAALEALNSLELSDQIKIATRMLFNQKIKNNIKLFFRKLKSNRRIEDIYFSFWKTNGLYDFLKDKDVKKRFLENLDDEKSLLSIKKFEYKYWLQGLLHVEDRSSMYASVESRVPLLDHRIIEYVFKLKPQYMINGVLNKTIFIDAYKDILHEDVYSNTQKKGYSAPIARWFEDEKTKMFISSVLENERSYIYNYVRFLNKNDLTKRQIWMLISLEIWHKIFITKELTID